MAVPNVDKRAEIYCSGAEYINHGSFGRIYSCDYNGKEAVMKIITVEFPGANRHRNEEILERIKGVEEEVSTMLAVAPLRNQNLMPIYSSSSNMVFDDETGEPWGIDMAILMPRLISLQELTKSKYLSQKEVLKLGIDMANALSALHSYRPYGRRSNILHRDVRVGNMFYNARTNNYVLGDFGLAKITSKVNPVQTKIVTRYISAPEVEKGGVRYNERSDIYSLCMTLWMLLNGDAPFYEEAAKIDDERFTEEKIEGIRLSGRPIPKPVSPLGERLDPKLVDIILKGVRFNPARRIGSAEELKRLLMSVIRKSTGL